MKEKQQQLLFDKGITNVPSDALCSDNALEESLGMVYDNGEHRVIQKPKEFITGSGLPRIVYIHKTVNDEVYIGYNVTNNRLYWYTKTYSQLSGGVSLAINFTEGTQFTSIGNTLIISDANGLHYFLWKYDENSFKYVSIGTKIPEPEFECRLEYFSRSSTHVNVPLTRVYHQGDFSGIFSTRGAGAPDFDNSKQEDYNNLVVGLYSKNKKSIARKKCFCNPFFVRYAIELYDGTYTYIGNPILLMPSVTQNSYVELQVNYGFLMCTTMFQLMITQKTDFSDWSYIVKGVVLFASDDIDIYDTSDDIEIYTSLGSFYTDAIIYDYEPHSTQTDFGNRYIKKEETDTPGFENSYNPFETKRAEEFTKELERVSVFYKLCELGREPINEMTSTHKFIEKGVVENITTQDQLPNDDYFSRSLLNAKTIFSYNNRLNIANVERGFFDGFGFFSAVDDYSRTNGYNSKTTTYYVAIKTNEGNKVVKHETDSSKAFPGFFFYYPDSRAYSVTIKRDNTYHNYKLTEHSSLNGAYFIANIEFVANEDGTLYPPNTTTDQFESVSNSPESLPNQLLTSEVNNPWVFKAEGYNNVGLGEIIGLSTITTALSEGQFGQFPLLVFSTDGILAMSLNSTGVFTSAQPMSREVCNNTKSITQTDGAVFFSSEKGLMVIVGNQAKCVSEQLSGKTNEFTVDEKPLVKDLGDFNTFMKNCFIAYDYRDSLLWLFNQNDDTCYIYSIKSGTFGKFDFGTGNAVTNVVNYYPDYLIQNSSGVYSLLGRDNINDDDDPYESNILTRPMKLENALALKSIMQIKHIYDMNDDATLSLRIFASNNLKNWIELHSLRGTPWKYYRFSYDFANLKATDRFAGTMLITQERRTDKLR